MNPPLSQVCTHPAAPARDDCGVWYGGGGELKKFDRHDGAGQATGRMKDV